MELEFDPVTFVIAREQRDDWPRWTDLDHDKCEHCPLKQVNCPRCPMAESLLPVLQKTGHLVSHTPVELTVIKPTRRYVIDTTAQDAVRSLMGLIIPASGCPYTAFFRPMARFHLPCSDEDETLYRSVSMYALAGHLRAAAGLEVEPGLHGLAEIYADVNLVNIHMAQRLRPVCEKDSSLNAITMLDVFAQMLPMQFEETLDDLRPGFEAFLK